MNRTAFEDILRTGENIHVEFKCGGSGFEDDSFETVCSFLNRFGGDLFLGVLDDGTIVGVPPKAAPDMKKNFIKRISNPNTMSPAFYLEPEIFEYAGKTIVHVHIPVSAEVHAFKGTVYTQNANRASWEGLITPDNMEPNPKNPIIASFFRNIGLADRLGSGVRNLFEYSKFYSGKDPVMQEKDRFTITVPLMGLEENKAINQGNETLNQTLNSDNGTLNETLNSKNDTLNETLKDRILGLVKINASINQSAIAKELNVSLTTIKREMKELKENGLLIRKGAKKDGKWLVNDLD